MDKINNKKISSVIELAGNQGVLSRKISRLSHVKRVLCSDYDYGATNVLFINQLDSLKTSPSNNLYVCNFDFMLDYREHLHPERATRIKSECLVALAVTHHLMLTQQYSLDVILSILSDYTSKYLIIEFMPLGLWDGKSAPKLPKWYSREFFENMILTQYQIIDSSFIEENRIIYFCEKL